MVRCWVLLDPSDVVDQVRRWYADYRIVEVEWQYTMGQGETRIGINRVARGTAHHVKASHELLILGE